MSDSISTINASSLKSIDDKLQIAIAEKIQAWKQDYGKEMEPVTVVVRDAEDSKLFKLAYSKELSDKLLLGDEGLFIKGEVVRLVGVSVSKLDDGSYRQLNLFDDALLMERAKGASTGSLQSQSASLPDPDRQKKLDEMTSKLQSEFGKDIIKKGSSL